MQIVTNNKPRPILSYWELNDKQKKIVMAEYGHLLDDIENHHFIFYKGWPYLLADFTIVRNSANLPHDSPIVMGGWHGYLSDSFFSGVLIKLLPDYETCIIGTFYA